MTEGLSLSGRPFGVGVVGVGSGVSGAGQGVSRFGGVL